jgi:31-O-methyltransferase
MLHRASPSLYRAAGQMAVKWLQSGRECVQCRLTSVSHLLRRHGISSVDLLKIDVERAELDVLRGVRVEDWLSISQVAMEVHEEHMEEVKCLLQYVAKFDRVEFMQTPDLVGTSIFMGYSSRS